MKPTMMIATLALLLNGAVMAETTEERCRKIQYDYFDLLTTTCPDNERRGVPGSPVCPDLLFVTRKFIPTAKIPDMATYRMMWSELLIEVCVHFPQSSDK